MRIKISRDVNDRSYHVFIERRHNNWRQVAIESTLGLHDFFWNWCSEFEGVVGIQLKPGEERIFEVHFGKKPKKV